MIGIESHLAMIATDAIEHSGERDPEKQVPVIPKITPGKKLNFLQSNIILNSSADPMKLIIG